ncbi:hypothetical protein H671_6g15683 [Cricetulus griseus]|uniref:Uncharacterized protein n=1 Tax=Cricetulus griseus TaxID=10029 RepID=A0A061HXR5_CRIGR|nr:hypothetical protein H671_6g15683 [Cricetulus griseus]
MAVAIDFDMTNILKNPKAHATSVNKEESSMSKVTIKKSFLDWKPSTPPAPTYYDIIKETKRKLAKNQKDFSRAKERIKDDIKSLKEKQEKIDKELDRLQAKASRSILEVQTEFDNFLHKMRIEAKLQKELKGSSTSPSLDSSQPSQPSKSSSSLSTKKSSSKSEDFNQMEEG